jgi:hypothetical protein
MRKLKVRMGTAIHLRALGKEKPGSKIKAMAATSGYSRMRGNILGEISALKIPPSTPPNDINR